MTKRLLHLLSTIDWIILLHVLNFHIRNKISKKALLYKYYPNIFPLSHIIVASIKLKLAGRTISLTEIRFHRFVSCDPLSTINETTKLSSRPTLIPRLPSRSLLFIRPPPSPYLYTPVQI